MGQKQKEGREKKEVGMQRGGRKIFFSESVYARDLKIFSNHEHTRDHEKQKLDQEDHQDLRLYIMRNRFHLPNFRFS